MARKDTMMGLRQILMRRRDALRQALAGDLSLLKELRQQNSGDVIDAALDTAQDEISSQLAEVESRELTSIETALERMRKGDYGRCDGSPTTNLFLIRPMSPGDLPAGRFCSSMGPSPTPTICSGSSPPHPMARLF